MPYPVTFKADYVEKRSRLTTFFRLMLAIPHLISVYFYGLAAGVVVIIAWFALLFTGRYPQGMYDFVAGSLRYSTRVYGYLWLLTDEYPPFSGERCDRRYPVDLNIGPPKAEYSRLKVLFRIILAIPVLIIHYAMQIVAQVGAFIAWFAIVLLGRQPKGLQDMIALGTSYQQRAYAYLALITEDWPPFTDETAGRTRRGRAGVRRAGLEPAGRGPRAPDLGAARRLRLARARGGLPVRAAPRPSPTRRPRSPSRPRRRRPPTEPSFTVEPAESAAPAPPPAAGARARAAVRARAAGADLRRPARRRRRAPAAAARARADAPSPSPPSPGDWPDPEPASGRPRPATGPTRSRRSPRRRRRGRAAARPVRAELDQPVAAAAGAPTPA